MILLTICILTVGLVGCCNCSLQLPSSESSSILGDNVVVLCLLAAFGTIALVGACALCFRRKKTFEKLENESGAVEDVKKNEYPIFRALAADGANESSAIVPSERNNLSRDNLLSSSDNLVTDGGGSSPQIDAIDSSDIVLIEKATAPSVRDRTQTTSSITRDTITYETEKDIKKQLSPSSSTPLLYANNVQSYQHAQTTNEQMQQKSVSKPDRTSLVTSDESYKDFYDKDDEQLETVITDEVKQDFMAIDISEDSKEEHSGVVDSQHTNPFFTSNNGTTIVESQTVKDDGSEVESDNNEKYQILDEETDSEDNKMGPEWEDESTTVQRESRRNSDCSVGDKNSIEEALRALDIAIGSEDDGEESEHERDAVKERMNIEEVKEEAKYLVDLIVNDCEKILDKKTAVQAFSPKCGNTFEDFCSLNNQNMSTPCVIRKGDSPESIAVSAKVLFNESSLDVSDINDETFPISPPAERTFDVPLVNDKTFELPAIKIDKEENCSEDLTTVTPVNTPIELSYSSETWDKMTGSKGAISKQPTETLNKTVTLESDNDTITFNQDGWYLHPQAKNDTFEVCDYEEEEGDMEDMSSKYDLLRRHLTEMLPHAQGMSQHNDFLDDDDLNKDSSSPSENYGIKYGDLDEASNAESFDIIGAMINPEPPPPNEMHINYKRPLSPIMEESECDETCRTFVFNNETKLLDSTSTGIMESASAEAQMGQIPKALMASNDTLFNFEDTLSDQTDNLLMSPRMITAGSSGSSTLSRQESYDKISLERTPTNEDPPKSITDVLSKSQELAAIDIMKNSIRQYPLNLELNSTFPSTSKYEVTKLALEDGSWPLDLPEAQQIVNDLSSPEQNKTGDSLSFEQDVTYTIDDQKTCVSLILKDDDERISEISEPIFASESLDLQPDYDEDDDRASSLQIDDIVSMEADDNFNFEVNDVNGNQDSETKEMELTLNVQEAASTVFDNDSINPENDGVSKNEFEIDSLEPVNKSLPGELEADSILTSHTTSTSKSVYSSDSINTLSNNSFTVQSDKIFDSDSTELATTTTAPDSSDSEASDKKKLELKIVPTNDKVLLLNKAEITFHELHMAKLTTFDFFKKLTDMHETVHDEHCSTEIAYNSKHHFMSGEDDPWGSQTDIRQVPCNQGIMSTSFTKEWSDDDSSHSSEEFLFVKGGVEDKTPKPNEETEKQGKREQEQQSTEKSSENIEIFEVELGEMSDEWRKSNDHMPATPIFHGDEPQMTVESEEDESAEEGEFVPSSWDHSLQPKRSSLKSPEREAVENQKKSRRVAFKIQRYHSVYEYPSEVVQMSPAYSEPRLWSSYMDDYSGNIDYFTYTHQLSDPASDFPQEIDGFSVSSSSRPFHSSNLTQLHNTWPNDSTDFSWSQIQDMNESEESTSQHQIPLKIEWPSRKILGLEEDDSDERADSGVGESSDSPSMGELCHTKGSLRLPLELVSSTSSEVSDFMSDHGVTKEQEAITIEITNDDDESLKQPKSLLDEDESDKMILPTPSCTGSMDSLSSNSGNSSSERGPPSFTTFGKDITSNENGVGGRRTSIIFIEDDVESSNVECQKNVRNVDQKVDEKYILCNKLTLTVGSSDDDSGFENISRLAIK